MYYSRGKISKADVELAGTPYWSKSTVEEFCEQEKKRLKMNLGRVVNGNVAWEVDSSYFLLQEIKNFLSLKSLNENT